jgi:DMSO/TMAO reductase YedYZ molybdopterin-dependent catalytic subunit
MTELQRKREQLAEAGIDPSRLPPGQFVSKRFPVFTVGQVPKTDLAAWDFTVGGLAGSPLRLGWEEFRALPADVVVSDIHCVTKWSKFDTKWQGVAVQTILDLVDPNPAATHVVVRAEEGYTVNLSMDDFARPDNLFAWSYGGEDLEPDHGWPLRLVVPHLYFWKSAKWVRGFDLLDHDEPGFWERAGYHLRGDPFQEQRYWGD